MRRDNLDRERCDLTTVVNRVATMVPSLGGNVDVLVESSTALPPVVVDADKITQVFLNLALNAIEAMPKGGQLRFQLAPGDDGGGVEVKVIDSGNGIPSGVDVFEPFVTTKPTGTGLGLAIARQLVTSHHGTLRHQPTPGGGTTFVVDLPSSTA